MNLFEDQKKLNTTSDPAEIFTFLGPLLAKLPESESILLSDSEGCIHYLIHSL